MHVSEATQFVFVLCLPQHSLHFINKPRHQVSPVAVGKMKLTSFDVQCSHFNVNLSHWDTVFPHWGITFPPRCATRIHCFALSQSLDKTNLIHQLQIAFYHTVRRLPFLAGSIMPPLPDNPPWHHRLIPKGAARLNIKTLSTISFAELEKENFAQHLFDSQALCPNLQEEDSGGSLENSVAVCKMQANFINGGLLLVVSVSHIVADGRGVTDIVKIFANNFCKAQAGDIGYTLALPLTDYRSDRRQILKGNASLCWSIDMHSAWTSSPPAVANELSCQRAEIYCRTYRISAESLAALKRTVSSAVSSSMGWVSTNDVICAFIWRGVMAARHRAGLFHADNQVHLAQSVDCRERVGIFETYFGNTVYMTQGSIAFAKLCDQETGIATAAQLCRKQINEVSGDLLKDLVRHAEQAEAGTQARMRIAEHLFTTGIIVTSHFKFGLSEVDFGPAVRGSRIASFRLPGNTIMAGTAVILPRLEDGSCEFMVSEQQCTLNCLMEDGLFHYHTKMNNEGIRNPIFMDQNHPLPSSLPVISLSGGDNKAAEGAHESGSGMTTQTVAVGTVSLIDITTLPAQHMGLIKVITLNHPSAKNALGLQLLRQLRREAEQLHEEHHKHPNRTRAVIVASAVDGVFSVGADLKERAAMNSSQINDYLELLRITTSRLAVLPIPTIAAVAGFALGGGLELALCCSFRVFSADAIVGLPETRLGIIPGAGATYRLPELIGLSRARELILSGRRIQAAEALSIGLCNSVVDTDTQLGESRPHQSPPSESCAQLPKTARTCTMEGAINFAQEICSGAPLATKAAWEALSNSPSAAREASLYGSLLKTDDRLEGLASFLEKRRATFVGR